MAETLEHGAKCFFTATFSKLSKTSRAEVIRRLIENFDIDEINSAVEFIDRKVDVKSDYSDEDELKEHIKIEPDFVYSLPQLEEENKFTPHFLDNPGTLVESAPGKIFTTSWKGNGTEHLQSVPDQTTYSCDCGFTTVHKDSLKQHKTITHGETKLCCEEPNCDFTAKWKSAITKHVRRCHQGIRFPCDKCDYVGVEKRNLTRHLMKHDENCKTFFCDQCDYKTGETRHLRLHIDSKHRGILFPCDMCEYKATVKKDLKRHKNAVHLGIRHKCDICEKHFKYKSNVTLHMKTVHKNEDP
jgi:hypothetical protein